jgi:hypothetical protein
VPYRTTRIQFQRQTATILVGDKQFPPDAKGKAGSFRMSRSGPFANLSAHKVHGNQLKHG